MFVALMLASRPGATPSYRILYSLVSDRLALSVGDFLSTVCPEQIVLREVRKRGSGRPVDAIA